MFPLARTDGLTAKKLGDELVVFDTKSGSVHHLNRVAELVWRACDGRTDVPTLARTVGRATGTTDAGPAVELALELLSGRGLLATYVERATPERRRDRRDALKQLATALAIPMVLTVTAGKARAQLATGAAGAPKAGGGTQNQCAGQSNGAPCTLPGGGQGFCLNGVCSPGQP
jgi:hypothetical protein